MSASLSFTGPTPQCSIIVSSIPNSVAIAEVARKLSEYGALEFCRKTSKGFDESSYCIKATFYDPARAKDALRAIRAQRLPWPGLRVAKASTQRPLHSTTMRRDKCAALLNEAVGGLGWSTSILSLRTQPVASQPAPTHDGTGSSYSAGDLGMFVLERTGLKLPHGLIDDAASRRCPGGSAEREIFGAEHLKAAESSFTLPPELPITDEPHGGGVLWQFSRFPSSGFKEIRPPLVSGEKSFKARTVAVKPRNFGATELREAKLVPRRPDSHPQASAAAGRGGSAQAARTRTSVAAPPRADPYPVQQSHNPSSCRIDGHSCICAKVMVEVRNPDGSLSRSLGESGCACAPPTIGSRFVAVNEALARIQHAEDLAIALERSKSESLRVRSCEIDPCGATAGDIAEPTPGIPEARSKRARYGATLRVAQHDAIPEAVIMNTVGQSSLVPWDPASVRGTRAQAAESWRDLTFTEEQGAAGLHLKWAVEEAQRDAMRSFELRPW